MIPPMLMREVQFNVLDFYFVRTESNPPPTLFIFIDRKFTIRWFVLETILPDWITCRIT